MSDVVVDASVVGKLLFEESNSEAAAALFRDASAGSGLIAAPYLLPVEVTNIVRKRMRNERLPLERAALLIERMLALPIDLQEPPGLHQRALALTAAHSLGAHDAHYVALAEILGCDPRVDDGRLLRAVRGRLPFVHWIGDYPALEV